MKETGIIRRIDELGRVVIPKEIRKTLRINEGDPLEIYTESEKLLLKKFSPIGAIGGYAKTLCESLYESTSIPVIICDSDTVLAVKGQGTKEFEKQTISEELLRFLKSRKTLISDKNSLDKIKITPTDERNYAVQLIMPVLAQGDLIGGLIMLSKEAEIDAKVISLASFCIDFMARRA